MICHAVQYSDQMNCGICDLTWDMNDQHPPKCVIGTKPSKREWAIAADLNEIEKYRNEPKMFKKLMKMYYELEGNKMKGEEQKRRCTDANIEKLDAMSFDAYKDPKHLSSTKAEELAGNVIESVERNRLIMNPQTSKIAANDMDKDVVIHDPGSIDATLEERGNRYGYFDEESRVKHNIKNAMKDSKNWSKLSLDKKHALGMIALKITRILNGDPEYDDNWHDIGGYAKLIENNLEK